MPSAKIGRPKDTEIRMDRLHQAREAARQLVEAWEGAGRPARVNAMSFGNKAGLDATRRATFTEFFPLVKVPKSKPHEWQLGVLRDLLTWDDPVEMVAHLAEADPGTWLRILKEIESEPCSQAQERVIRARFQSLVNESRDGGGGHPFDGGKILWEQNKQQRSMY